MTLRAKMPTRFDPRDWHAVPRWLFGFLVIVLLFLAAPVVSLKLLHLLGYYFAAFTIDETRILAGESFPMIAGLPAPPVQP